MEPPIGRHLHRVARITQRAFNQVLEESGGSLPTWLILLSLKRRDFGTQQDLARDIGIGGPTLTHHLDLMEGSGFVVRERDPQNRRAMRVRLTREGETLFEALREAASGFDRKLRQGVSTDEVDVVRSALTRFAENAGGET